MIDFIFHMSNNDAHMISACISNDVRLYTLYEMFTYKYR